MKEVQLYTGLILRNYGDFRKSNALKSYGVENQANKLICSFVIGLPPPDYVAVCALWRHAINGR